MATIVPAVNLPSDYISGLKLNFLTATTVSVDPGVARDSTNTFDITLSQSTTVDISVNGLNGLDKGVVAASTWYDVFLISDPISAKPTGLLLTLQNDVPTMPFNYLAYRRIGVVRTNVVSQITNFYQSGTHQHRYYQWDTSINVINGGAAIAWTPISMEPAVPARNACAYFGIVWLATGAGVNLDFRTGGSTGGSTIDFVSSVAGLQCFNTVKILPTVVGGVATIEYIFSGAGEALNINVNGFDDFL